MDTFNRALDRQAHPNGVRSRESRRPALEPLERVRGTPVRLAATEGDSRAKCAALPAIHRLANSFDLTSAQRLGNGRLGQESRGGENRTVRTSDCQVMEGGEVKWDGPYCSTTVLTAGA
jgi:hypothetical protein